MNFDGYALDRHRGHRVEQLPQVCARSPAGAAPDILSLSLMMPLESRCEHRAAIHRGSSTASRCSSTIRVISRRSHLRPLTLMTHRSDFSLSQLSLFRLCVSIRSEPVSTRRDARFRVVLDALCRQQRLSHHSRGSARSISSALHRMPLAWAALARHLWEVACGSYVHDRRAWWVVLGM